MGKLKISILFLLLLDAILSVGSPVTILECKARMAKFLKGLLLLNWESLSKNKLINTPKVIEEFLKCSKFSFITSVNTNSNSIKKVSLEKVLVFKMKLWSYNRLITKIMKFWSNIMILIL